MKKLLVIGLDGAPFDLIQEWSQSGHLPNIANLIKQGSFGVLRSTIPVHSPTAWTSFITGLNPGKHGVFDFVRRETGGYQLRVIRANQIKGGSLWGWLGQNGRRVGVMNVPMTYPPEKVNGFLISGLGTPDYVNYTYPPELTEELNARGYRVNKKFFYTANRQDEWLDDIFAISEERGKTATRLMKENPCDFFMVVFRNTDEICHFYWHHMDESHPRYDPNAPTKYQTAIRDLYQLVDKQVGDIVDAAGENTNVILMSDHGAGPLYRDVFLNEWLWQQGWLKLKREPTSKRWSVNLLKALGITRKNISDTLTWLGLHRIEVWIKKILGDRIHILPRDERPEFINAIDWSQTKAYSFGYYGQIFINLQGREPDGIVQPGKEYEDLRQEIAHQLQQIIDPEDGLPVVDKVYTKEELYDGPFLDEAPDLVTIMRGFSYITRKGYEFARERGVLFREPYTEESGSHRIEGILIGAGPDIIPGQSLSEKEIQDLTPTLLNLLHCPIPSGMDGQPIVEMLTPKFRKHHPLEYTDAMQQSQHDESDEWDAETEAEITERLKKLGYLG
jgi:predicted AlkP superfamily phosphohydrolase/phosphomutase